MHEHCFEHSHDNETEHGVKGIEELVAVLKHTVHHNIHHMEDLNKLATKAEALGHADAAGKIELAETHFKAVNESLNSALEMLK